jgi:hypothetical protein
MQQNLIAKKLFLIAIITLGWMGPSLVSAQGAAPSEQPGQQPPMQTEFSDNELKAFAEAYVQVNEITGKYAPRIEQAQDPDEAVQIQQEATSAMVEVIEGQENLDVETYNAIATAVSTDPELGEKITRFIEQSERAQ